MKLIFGDNQFLGINHTSDVKADHYYSQYSDPENIAELLRYVWKIGIKDFAFTVHPKTIKAINIVSEECPFKLHVSLPYAHSINDLILEKGLVGAGVEKITQGGFFKALKACISTTMGKYEDAIDIGIKTEISDLCLDNIYSINLLNIATDFLLGINRSDLLVDFNNVVVNRFNKKSGFYTMNYPKLADKLWGEHKLECALFFNYNQKGFRTNPSLVDLEHSMKKYQDYESIAMSVFSGSFDQNPFEFVKSNKSIKAVLFGSSSKLNIENNYLQFCKKPA